ncbi:tRNA (guanosine(37)-N1)-methyltransferase TrmD [Rubrimonas sp.]|uniref:tRNA (guanosine(37)-N1)-methyltransferase TrmD n=1 Tax=Rubrimonas sp. TaxID=2036015 RepID=UPI002FDCAC92
MNGAPPPRSHGRLALRPTLKPRPLIEDAPDIARAWRATVLTIFPGLFPGPLAESLTGRALAEGLWSLQALDIRDFARDKHRSVDGPPAGGGPGMVMRPDVVAAAIDAAADGERPVIYLSPRGRPFGQARARELASGRGAILLCGRFEGVDQRVLDARDVEELSLGDFVLTGGEIAAMAVIDAAVRLLPGVLGNAASTVEESFSAGLLEAPHYTKPQRWEGREVPEVLLSGHHARIAEWRRSRAEALTRERRPDLWRAYVDPTGEAEQSGAQTSAATGGRGKD